MRILVTAGNTLTLIDRVRAITNIFTGRTGTRIALHAVERGHAVTLLTSHPEVVDDIWTAAPPSGDRLRILPYRTFEDLHEGMESAIRIGEPAAVIHCAAVSDYRAVGVYAPAPGTRFREADASWEGEGRLVDRAAAKVKSDEPEVWLRLVRTPKLVDLLRGDWGFRGVLVKFKLEVGLSDEALLDVAERSRRQSDADLMVANTLEGADRWAFLGPVEGGYQRVSRAELAARLLDAIEGAQRGRGHG